MGLRSVLPQLLLVTDQVEEAMELLKEVSRVCRGREQRAEAGVGGEGCFCFPVIWWTDLRPWCEISNPVRRNNITMRWTATARGSRSRLER